MAFEKGMKAARQMLELFRYDAEHGFGNEQRLSVHDRHAAELAWTAPRSSSGSTWGNDVTRMARSLPSGARSRDPVA